MICGEAREYLFAFLDNELDAPLSIELQRHLDGCPSCAREAEIERTIRKRLSHRLRAAGGDLLEPAVALAGALAPLVAPAADLRPLSPATRLRRRRRLATAAAVLLMVGAGAWVALDRSGWPRTQPIHHAEQRGAARFTRLLVDDFEHFLEEGRRVQYASERPAELADWLGRQTALAVVLPAAPEQHGRLVGGRKCKIDGRPAAFASYELNGRPASLVIVTHQPQMLTGLREVRDGDAIHWLDRWKGYTVLACRRDGLVYAAVSELPEDELLRLMRDALDESD